MFWIRQARFAATCTFSLFLLMSGCPSEGDDDDGDDDVSDDDVSDDDGDDDDSGDDDTGDDDTGDDDTGDDDTGDDDTGDDDTGDDDTSPVDADGDGYDSSVDCDDNNAAVNPGAAEVCDNGVDDDCDAATLDLFDGDSDGDDCSVDCDDGDAAVGPSQAEVCDNGVDDDCDAATVDLFDLDGDSATCDVDCDDGDAAVYPGAPDAECSGVDEDCDGLVEWLVPTDEATIGDAVAAATDGDRVCVLPGTYPEATIDFGGKNLEVLGTAGAAQTFVEGTTAGDYLFRYVTLEGATSILRDLTITRAVGADGGAIQIAGGASPHLQDLVITGGHCAQHEGVVWVEQGTPGFERVVFDANDTPGTYTSTLRVDDAVVILDECDFTNNTGITSGWHGALMLGIDADVTVRDAWFSGNDYYAVGVKGLGQSVLTIEDSVIEDSTFGAIQACTNTVLTVERTEIVNNGLPSNSDLGNGASVIMSNGGGSLDVTVRDCLIEGNVQPTHGPIWLSGSSGTVELSNTAIINNPNIANDVPYDLGPYLLISGNGGITATITNCTIAFHGVGGQGLINPNTPVTVRNSIIWNPDSWFEYEPTWPVDLEYSIVRGGSGLGVLDEDPLLVAADDPHLQSLSPAIDAGNSTEVPGWMTVDLFGDSRIENDPQTTDTGVADPVSGDVVDMGVAEVQP